MAEGERLRGFRMKDIFGGKGEENAGTVYEDGNAFGKRGYG